MTSQQTDFYLPLYVGASRTYFYKPSYVFKGKMGFFRLTGTPLGVVSVAYEAFIPRPVAVKRAREMVRVFSAYQVIMIDLISAETDFAKRQRLQRLYARRFDYSTLLGAIDLLNLSIL